MHFEILVEDISGARLLNEVLPKICSDQDTWAIHSYKGIGGKVPQSLATSSDPSKRILLTELPRLLRGYGNTFSRYPKEYKASVILVVDLDDRNKVDFLNDLNSILSRITPRPETRFCFAIEEGEAWLLGDIPAIKKSYPKAKDTVLFAYVNDSICGTWETLADAVYPGGARKLKQEAYNVIGKYKYDWAASISPNMNVDDNSSPSFNDFKSTVKALSDL